MLKTLYADIIEIIHSDHPFICLTKDIFNALSYIWNYEIFITPDKQSILVSNVIFSIILFLVGLKIAKRLSIAVTKRFSRNLDISATKSLEKISHYCFIILIAVFLLDISNVPLTVFTVIGTTLALGFGLGSQNIVNNFISGLIIMVERPLKLGDIIEIQNITGKVLEIGARCVTVQTDDNINMLIPNSNILQEVIINWTHIDTTLKGSLILRIESNFTIKELDKIILDAMNSHPNILKEPAAQIFYKSIYKTYYELEVEYWLDLVSSIKAKHITNDINRALSEILKKHNISKD